MAAFKEFLKNQSSSLPRMPVPPLKQTMEIYLKYVYVQVYYYVISNCASNFRSAKPFLSEEEYQATENVTKEFSAAGGCGEKLQKLLEERAAKLDNWVGEKIT